MKNILLALFVLILIGCTEKESHRTVEHKSAAPVSKAMKVDLETLIEAFNWRNDNKYEMNRKYVGKKLTVTGRTSGVREDGVLVMQVRPTESTVRCIEISDPEFLMSVKEDDIVEITGIFQREHVGSLLEGSLLKDCSSWKIISKSNR